MVDVLCTNAICDFVCSASNTDNPQDAQTQSAANQNAGNECNEVNHS